MKTKSSLRKEQRKKNKHCVKNKQQQNVAAEKEQHMKNHSSKTKTKKRPNKSQEEEVQQPTNNKKTKIEKKKKESNANEKTKKTNNKYSNLNPEVAQAFEADDIEIRMLEEKLGISKKKDKLSKEYSKLECYGDDFMGFLDGLDDIVDRALLDGEEEEEGSMEGVSGDEDGFSVMDSDGEEGEEGDSMDDDDKEELLKEGPPIRDDTDDEYDSQDDDNEQLDVIEEEEDEEEDDNNDKDSVENESGSEEEEDLIQEESNNNNAPLYAEDEMSNNNDDNSEDEEEEGEDHAASDTYTPSSGEDIYGNPLTSTKATPVSKYVPPHLRKSKQNSDKTTTLSSNTNSKNNNMEEDIPLELTRATTSVLNKLSNDTIDSITKQIMDLYSDTSNATLHMNQSIFTVIQKTTLEKAVLMDKLIPLYSAFITGVHICSMSGENGDSNIDLASYMMEHLILQYRIARDHERTQEENKLDDSTVTSMKTSCNYILFISYLYLFGDLSSQLMYDLIKEMITTSTIAMPELYLEHLVLILSNVGYQLRSDDPASLKHIILTLQQQQSSSTSSSSRYLYLMETLTQIKNNTKKKNMKKDDNDKVLHFKKYFGRMKRNSNASITDATSSILNITLQDILNIEKKGRWWKIGASWKDNSLLHGDADMEDHPTTKREGENNKYIQTPLQKTYFNTQLRKSIFQTIITSSDIDAGLSNIITLQTHYKKTSKQVFLKEVYYVLLQSCSMEMDHYNPYYSYLVVRLCDYYGKKKCSFTLQLLFWDLLFQQFNEEEDEDDDSRTRRMMNLTNMMIHFITKKILTLNILKGIQQEDWNTTLPHAGKLCLTLLFTKLLELEEEEDDIKTYITKGIARNEDGDVIRECVYVFLLGVMKHCPKMKGDGHFKKNWKIFVNACQKKSLDLF